MVNKLSENPEVKKKIRDELFLCMREMPYSKITIKNLVERLGMSRQNFYRYYMSKDEILLDLIDTTLDAAYEIAESNLHLMSNDVDAVAQKIEELIDSEKSLINEIISCSSRDVVFSHLQGFVRRIVGRIMRESNISDVDQVYLDIIISQYAGSGYYLIKCWAQNDGELAPEKFRGLISSFINGLAKDVIIAVN
ncbi:TetR/AcrR family transcriptional regulator [Spongiibacter marinus]|uniref:TetR/AcrR family transcriptional regulator n=1 Tax=Spongiibacter marinus TaxID=354246 RepID=UPI0035BE969D